MIRAMLLTMVSFMLTTDLPSHATECQKVKSDNASYWSWREIDGRRCWYRGRSGRPKAELHWPSVDDTPVGVAKQSGVEVSKSPLDSVPAPTEIILPIPAPAPILTDNTTPAPLDPTVRALTEDDLLAYICCWPELPSEPAAAELKPQTPMAPPHKLTWPWGLLPIVVYVAYRLFGLHLMRGHST